MGQVIHLDFTARRTKPAPAPALAPAQAQAAAPAALQAPFSRVDALQSAAAAPVSGPCGTGRQPRAQTVATAVDQR
jgi:hypothetical protein